LDFAYIMTRAWLPSVGSKTQTHILIWYRASLLYDIQYSVIAFHHELASSLLMTKVGKAEKTGLSNLGNQSIQFWQF
jgi:hypothetical protein